MSVNNQIRVHVLVDLIWSPTAGGHVKCWEKLAHAAIQLGDVLDLTVHFSGDTQGVHTIADNVRYAVHRPVFSTRNVPFLSHVPDHTDLAPYHGGLARALDGCDVIHTTDAYFAFAHTAVRVARRKAIPLVNSMHTDTPNYTRVFTAQTVERLFGRGVLSKFLLDGIKVHERAERKMLKKLARHQAESAMALVSRDDERRRALDVLPEDRVRTLRRGIDRDLFNPVKKDRGWLKETYGVPEDRCLLFHAGRLDRGKNVLVLAHASRRLIDQGHDVHLLCAGEGGDKEAVQDLLGTHVTCAGFVEGESLARLYASSDIFAFPSTFEVYANVVMEALASGLPVVLSAEGGMDRVIKIGETGLSVSGDDRAWADALAALVTDKDRRVEMGHAARRQAETSLPSWRDVLEQDLMPCWRRAHEEGARQ